MKTKESEQPELVFSGIPVSREDNTKHLGSF